MAEEDWDREMDLITEYLLGEKEKPTRRKGKTATELVQDPRQA